MHAHIVGKWLAARPSSPTRSATGFAIDSRAVSDGRPDETSNELRAQEPCVARRWRNKRASIVLLAAVLGVTVTGCTRAAPDATPDGALRVWLEKMETSAEDPRAFGEAYPLLGPRARANLEARAERASRSQGRRFQPREMLAVGHFGLKFRPKTMTAHVTGDDAIVDVRGEGDSEFARVRCTREKGGWRVEPDLPEVTNGPRT